MARAEGAPSRVQRWLAYGLGLGLPVAVLSPSWSGLPDSFPLSTYPMFASARGQPTLHTLVGQTADGAERRLPPELVGTKEVLQAKVLIQRSVAEGPDAMSQLCEAAAARAAATAEFSNVRTLLIVARRYDPVAYFVTGPTPLDQEIVFHCDVPPGKGAFRP